MHWEMPPQPPSDNFVRKMSDSILRDTFELILRNLNICDNEQVDKLDKFLKLRLSQVTVFIQRGEQIHQRIYDSLLRNSWQKSMNK